MKNSILSPRNPEHKTGKASLHLAWPVALVILVFFLAGCNAEILTPTAEPLDIPPSPTSALVEASPPLPAEAVTSTPEPELPPTQAQTEPVVPVGPAEGTYAVVGIAPGEALALHSAPNADSPLTGQIPPDATDLKITGDVQNDVYGNPWAPVAYQEQTGWVDRGSLAGQAGTPPAGLANAALQVVQALKRQDFPQLAGWVPADGGLRFSPYSFVRPEDQIFDPTQVYYLLADSRVFPWGTQDGSGEAIELSFPDYYQRYIFDVDFSRPEAVGFDVPLSSGSRINNIAEFYPGAAQVEYYFSGFDPQYGGMDWRSLRLVFAPQADGWKLVGIVHDEWGP